MASTVGLERPRSSPPSAVGLECPWSSPPICPDSLCVGFDVAVDVKSADCFCGCWVSLGRVTVTIGLACFVCGSSMSTSSSSVPRSAVGVENWNFLPGADVADVRDEAAFNSNPCTNNSNNCYESGNCYVVTNYSSILNFFFHNYLATYQHWTTAEFDGR